MTSLIHNHDQFSKKNSAEHLIISKISFTRSQKAACVNVVLLTC